MADLVTIFIGRSGCGKGTQADLLLKHFARREPATPNLYLVTGDRFRELVGGSGLTSRLVGEWLSRCERLPDFLAVWNWADWFQTKYQAGARVVIDGAPRSPREAELLLGALDFYQLPPPTVIHLAVSHDWAKARLLGRGRADDREEADVERRLAWFETEVAPALAFLKNRPEVRVLEVNGERPVEVIHQEIVAQLTK